MKLSIKFMRNYRVFKYLFIISFFFYRTDTQHTNTSHTQRSRQKYHHFW